jgi:hypothetical protein
MNGRVFKFKVFFRWRGDGGPPVCMDFPLLEKQSIVLLMPIPRSEILGKSLLFLHIHKEEAARPKGNKEIFEDFLIFSWMIKKW